MSEALSRGGDYGDIYLEHTAREFLTLEEGILKHAGRNILEGAGIRVISGEKTGYAYADGFDMAEIGAAARTAGVIAARGDSADGRIPGGSPPRGHDLYPLNRPVVEEDLAAKILLLESADRAARALDSRIAESRIVLLSEIRHVAIFNSNGALVEDTRPLSVFQVSCIAEENGDRQIGIKGGGGRSGMEFFDSMPPEHFAREAAAQALRLLEAREAPAGPMTVVLGPGWPGILLHEAVGHGLEADFNRKGLSAFSGRIGQRVASELCSVVDDGTLPGRRGSLNVDDEGCPTGRTLLIEKGILRGYMQDVLSSRLTRAPVTGNGRRESYAFIPMPRMTNTFMLPGPHDPEEIIRSVSKGLYAANFGGGQVDITSGNFVFSASEAYLIEGGRLTAPVRGATLVGSGPEILNKVSMVGNQLLLDDGVGTCGKDGQSVPVGVGTPALRVDEMTVGGTAPS